MLLHGVDTSFLAAAAVVVVVVLGFIPKYFRGARQTSLRIRHVVFEGTGSHESWAAGRCDVRSSNQEHSAVERKKSLQRVWRSYGRDASPRGRGVGRRHMWATASLKILTTTYTAPRTASGRYLFWELSKQQNGDRIRNINL